MHGIAEAIYRDSFLSSIGCKSAAVKYDSGEQFAQGIFGENITIFRGKYTYIGQGKHPLFGCEIQGKITESVCHVIMSYPVVIYINFCLNLFLLRTIFLSFQV
jgi:hypothetical protein